MEKEKEYGAGDSRAQVPGARDHPKDLNKR